MSSASSMSSLLPTLSEVEEEEDTWSIRSYDDSSSSSSGRHQTRNETALSQQPFLHKSSLSNRSTLTVSTTSSSSRSSSSRSSRSSNEEEEEEVDNPSTRNIHMIEDDDASSVQSMFSSDSTTTLEDEDDEDDHPTHPVEIAPNELAIIQEVVEAGDWDTLLILSNAIFEDEFAVLSENHDDEDDSSAVASSSYSSSYGGDEDLNSHCTNSHVQDEEEDLDVAAELLDENNGSSQPGLFQAKKEDEDETTTSSSSEFSQPQDLEEEAEGYSHNDKETRAVSKTTSTTTKPRRWGLRRLLSRNTLNNTTNTKSLNRPVVTKFISYTTRSQRTTLTTPPRHNSHSCRGPRRSIPDADANHRDEIEQRRQQQKQQQQDEQILQGLEAVLEELRMRVRVSQHHLLNTSTSTSLHDPDDEKNYLVVQRQQIHQIEQALNFYQNRLMRLASPCSSCSNVVPTPPEILETLAMIPIIMSESI